jgi:hypothetical protein
MDRRLLPWLRCTHKTCILIKTQKKNTSPRRPQPLSIPTNQASTNLTLNETLGPIFCSVVIYITAFKNIQISLHRQCVIG